MFCRAAFSNNAYTSNFTTQDTSSYLFNPENGNRYAYASDNPANNRYAYASDNSHNHTDPSGQSAAAISLTSSVTLRT